MLQGLSHLKGIHLLVRLAAEGVDGRTLRSIQHFGLEKGLVDILPHLPAQGVNLENQMPLGRAADVRITGHESDRIHGNRENDGLQTQARTGQSRLAARMARPDHHDIVIFMDHIHCHDTKTSIQTTKQSAVTKTQIQQEAAAHPISRYRTWRKSPPPGRPRPLCPESAPGPNRHPSGPPCKSPPAGRTRWIS